MKTEEQNISLDDIYSSEEDSEKKEIKSKNRVEGEAFRKLQIKAKRLGAAKSRDYSKRKDKKYTVTL